MKKKIYKICIFDQFKNIIKIEDYKKNIKNDWCKILNLKNYLRN